MAGKPGSSAWTDVDLRGLGRVHQQLAKVNLDISDLDLGVLTRRGVRLARANAPVKSGRLVRSIRESRTKRAKNYATIQAGSGGKRLVYAPIIEFGWYKRHIRPVYYMTRAGKEMRRIGPHLLEQQVRAIVRNRGLS